jgi:hypothetical protein
LELAERVNEGSLTHRRKTILPRYVLWAHIVAARYANALEAAGVLLFFEMLCMEGFRFAAIRIQV